MSNNYDTTKEYKVGLVIGSGTGEKLGNIFTQTLKKIEPFIKKQIKVVKCDYEFSSYEKLRSLSFGEIEKVVQEELERLKSFYKNFYSDMGRVIFRTAFNAETLYQFRRIGMAIKIIDISYEGKRFFIVRDEMQGFYTNDSYEIDESKIKFTGSFSKEKFGLITKFAMNEAKKNLNNPFEIFVSYKHHLFANIIDKWVKEFLPNAKICQPNHLTELLYQLFTSLEKKDFLIIVGNEVGDILHEAIIFSLNIGTRQTLFSKNIYLHPDFKNLVEYQTVHGSADDIARLNIVNPTATLKIVGRIVEDEFGVQGFYSIVDEAIKHAYDRLSYTAIPPTDKIVNYVHSYLLNECRSSNYEFRNYF